MWPSTGLDMACRILGDMVAGPAPINILCGTTNGFFKISGAGTSIFGFGIFLLSKIIIIQVVLAKFDSILIINTNCIPKEWFKIV